MKTLMLMIATLQYSLCFEKLMENIKKIQEGRDEELFRYKGDEYMIQSTKKIGKLMFDSMDVNKDGFVSKDEMVEFGKVMVSNNTDYLDIWVQGNFKNDENQDKYLTFEEFYKPQNRMGRKPVHEEL